MNRRELRAFLDKKVEEYNRPSFITDDPIGVPRRYSKKQDIEIAAFFAAIFSWGNRTTIIRKSQELMQLMDQAPHQFVLQHEEKDLRRLLDFKHRTFTATDLLYFVAFFRHHYTLYDSLEEAFLKPWEKTRERGRAGVRKNGAGRGGVTMSAIPDGQEGHTAEASLSAFRHYFFSLEAAGEPGALLAPPRTYKHISSPEKNSSCKRLNMFLRWMVRKDDKGVDFGIWERIPPSRLICPLDLHVARVARRFGLLTRTQTDWQAAMELTGELSLLDPEDPVKYDFALFGLGVMEKF
jgi:uncharacterized protein (TIGR02757 family)